MMKTISLKIDEIIFEETEEILLTCKKPRNRYINEALIYYNHAQKRLLLEMMLQRESKAVHASSMEVLRDFENIDDELQTV